MANAWTIIAALAALIYLLKKCDILGGFSALTTDSSTAGSSGGFLDQNDATQAPAVSDPAVQDPPVKPVGLGASGFPAINPLTNNKFTAVQTRIEESGTRMESRTNRNYDPRGPSTAEIEYFQKGDFSAPGGFQENTRLTEGARHKQEYLQYRDPAKVSRSTIML
jgi:hypothetical protein